MPSMAIKTIISSKLKPMLKATIIQKLVIFFSLMPAFSFCQDATVVTPAAYGAGIKINYVRSWDAVTPTTDPNTLTLSTTMLQARMATQYIDGLGRPLQTVVKQGSYVTGGNAVDMVSPV